MSTPPPNRRRDSCASVRRFDRAEIGELRPAATSQEGFLLVDVYIAKPGVLTYRDISGQEWRELITADELHRADSLATLVGKPVTLEHPDDDVDPDNADRHSKGAIGENITVMQDGRVRIVYMVQKRDAISEIQTGRKREASPGYVCDIDNTPGVHPEFGPYDRVQKNRRYNHGAICSRARGGPEIHLRYDSDAAMVAHNDSKDDDMDPKLVAALIAALSVQGFSRQDAEGEAAKMADMMEENKKLKADNEAMKAKLDKFEAASAKKDEEGDEEEPGMSKKDALEFARQYAADRRALESVASRFDSVDVTAGALADNEALRKAIVLAANPNARKDGTPDYYAAAFDMIPAQPDQTPARQTFRMDNLSVGLENQTREDAHAMPNPEAEARAAMARASKR